MKAWGINVNDELVLSLGVWDTVRRAQKAANDWFNGCDGTDMNVAMYGVEVIDNCTSKPAETRANIATDVVLRVIGFSKYRDDVVLEPSIYPYYQKIRQCIMECIEEKESSPEEVAKRDKEIEERLSNGLVGMWITDTSCEVCCQVKRLVYSSKKYRGVEIYNEDDELALNYSLKNAEDLVKYHHFEETYGDGGWSVDANIIRTTDERPSGFSDYAKRDSDIVEEEQNDTQGS